MTKRVVLVTGGGIGIGRATSLAFADKDCHVVVTDVLEAEGNAVADEIRGKGGVGGLVRGLAVERARSGVRVNGVAPGYIRTAQLLSKEHSLGPEGAEAAASFIPMGRLGEPQDIADVIVFLASSGARYITGQIIGVDGGRLVGRY